MLPYFYYCDLLEKICFKNKILFYRILKFS
nr:MAG TPA_asm: hypothetical protein [Caudoviricetes sp.]